MEHAQENRPPRRVRDRAAFFQQYYEPLAANSLHGLAVVDTGSCSVLYANSRFLASHGVPPGLEFPLLCRAVAGLGQAPCDGESGGCLAVEAARLGREARARQARAGGDGLPARTTEIVAIPLPRRLGLDRGCEVVVVEKEAQALLEPKDAADAAREHAAAIVRYSADAIIGLDGDGRIRSWNQGAAEIFGYTEEETLGRDFDFLVPADEASRREWQAEQREFERRGILKNHQARRVAKDGRTVVVTSTSSLVRDATGRPLGVSMICRDVTMEVLLKELIDHQIRAMTVTHEIGDLLHSTRSVDEILQVILLGVTAGQGLGFNRAFLLLAEEAGEGHPRRLRGKMAIGPADAAEAGRIWGNLSGQKVNLVELYRLYKEQSSSLDSRVREIASAIDVPLDQEEHVLIRVLNSRQAANVLHGRVIGDDREVDRDLVRTLECESFAVVPLFTRDRALGVLVVDNRITGIGISDADLQMLKVFANHAGIALENSQLRANLERRLAELAQLNLAMQENQSRLMQAERLSVIGEMAARIVHEIRNPLVSIGGFARLVQKGIGEEDPRSDYLRIVSDEVARLERIIQELLDFSRPRHRLVLKEVDPNALVHELAAMAAVEAEAHGVKVVESYDASLGQVLIDPDKTRQVILNIVRNALDVMLDKGTLAVETAAVNHQRFRVTVRDTGPGIPAERRQEVFKPGFTTRRDGTGFGLAIAKRLVELQGGQIALRESEPSGCTFDILLPRRVQERADLEVRT